MVITALQKKRRTDIAPDSSMVKKEERLKAEIASTAGLGGGKTDPVSLMTKSYKQSFDAVGKARAEELAAKSSKRKNDIQVKGTEVQSANRKKHDFPEYSHSKRQLEQGDFCSRFSAVAFRGGMLAGAVLEGQAKNMFISCAARAKGIPDLQNEKQRRVLAETAIEKNVDAQPAKVVFNRDVRSAVGIAVDAIHGAGRVLDIFRKLAEGSGELQDNRLEMHEVNTIRQLYPFLSTDGDKALIKKYSEKIKLLENDNSDEAQREKKSMESALKKAQGVLDRKQSEQRQFLTQLNFMQSRAREAERLFTSESFAETVTEEIEAAVASDPPEDKKGLGLLAAAIAAAGLAAAETVEEKRERKTLNVAEEDDGAANSADRTDGAAGQGAE